MADETIKVSDIRGDATIATGAGNIVGKEVTIKGHVIQLVNPTPEAVKALEKIVAMPTEVQPGAAAGIAGSSTVQASGEAQKGIGEMLSMLKALQDQGKDAREVVAGELRLSRVDLMVKQAVLLKSEADQMMIDHIGRKKDQLGLSAALPGSTVQIDMNQVFADFDEAAREAKVKEAYGLLQEAQGIDPTNTEVLLHLAGLLVELTPDDPSDEQRLLYRIQSLLSNPKDDTERFRLATATFLVATTGEQVHVESLQSARAVFDRLGRTEWVQQCDALLESAGGAPPLMPAYAPTAPPAWPTPPPGQPQPMPHAMPSAPPPPPAMPRPGMPQAAAFQPVGRWQMQATDGSVTVADLYANGALQAVQTVMGMNIHGAGQWAFDPYNNMLQFQGMANGVQPFMFSIYVQGQQGNGYHGVGTDGHGYFLTRV